MHTSLDNLKLKTVSGKHANAKDKHIIIKYMYIFVWLFYNVIDPNQSRPSHRQPKQIENTRLQSLTYDM